MTRHAVQSQGDTVLVADSSRRIDSRKVSALAARDVLGSGVEVADRVRPLHDDRSTLRPLFAPSSPGPVANPGARSGPVVGGAAKSEKVSEVDAAHRALMAQQRSEVAQRIQQLDDSIASYRAAVLQLGQAKEQIVQRERKGLLELAWAIGRELAWGEFQRDPSLLQQNIDRLLADLASEQRVTIRVSHEDLAKLTAESAALRARGIELVADANMAASHIVVESDKVRTETSLLLRAELVRQALGLNDDTNPTSSRLP